MIEEDNEWPPISVVILNYNGIEFVERCLKSVLATDYPNFEVIFVDNASEDGSAKLVRKLFSNNLRLKIIENSENLGFAGGNNVGARHAMGDYMLFLNVDTEVNPAWLRELVKVMKSGPKIGAAQSKLLLTYDRRRFDSAGHLIDYCGVESPESADIRGQIDQGQYDRIREVFYARGAAIIIGKRVLNEVGLFDQAYFGNHEEIDLCWRIRLRGYSILYVPRSIVYHVAGGYWGEREDPRILFHLRKNHISSLIKNYYLKNVIKYLSRYLAYLYLHAGYKILRGEVEVALAYMKAILWVIMNFEYIYSERQRIQKLVRRVSDEDVMKFMTKPTIPWRLL